MCDKLIDPPDVVGYFSLNSYLGFGETKQPILQSDVIEEINGTNGITRKKLECNNHIEDMDSMELLLEPALRTIMTSLVPDFDENAKTKQIVVSEKAYGAIFSDDLPLSLILRGNTVYMEPDTDSVGWRDRVNEDKMPEGLKKHFRAGMVAQMKLTSTGWDGDSEMLFRDDPFFKITRRVYPACDLYIISFVDSMHQGRQVEIKCTTENALMRKKFNEDKRLARFVFDVYMAGMKHAVIGVKRTGNTADIDKVLIWDAADSMDFDGQTDRLHLRFSQLFEQITSIMMISSGDSEEATSTEHRPTGDVKEEEDVPGLQAVCDSFNEKLTIASSVTSARKLFCDREHDVYLSAGKSLDTSEATLILADTYHLVNASSLDLPSFDVECVTSSEFGPDHVMPDLIPGTRLILIADTYEQAVEMVSVFNDEWCDTTVLATVINEDQKEKLRLFPNVLRVLTVNSHNFADTLQGMRWGEDKIPLPSSFNYPVLVCSPSFSSSNNTPALRDVVEVDPTDWQFPTHGPIVTIVALDITDLQKVLAGFRPVNMDRKRATNLHILLDRFDDEDGGLERLQLQEAVWQTIGAHHARTMSVEEFHVDRRATLAQKLRHLGYGLGKASKSLICPTVVWSSSCSQYMPTLPDETAMGHMVYPDGYWFVTRNSPLLVMVGETADDIYLLLSLCRQNRLYFGTPVKVLIGNVLDRIAYCQLIDGVKRAFGVRVVEVIHSFKTSSTRPHPSYSDGLVALLEKYDIVTVPRPRNTWLILGNSVPLPSSLSLNNTNISRLENLHEDIFKKMRIKPEMMLLIGREDEKSVLDSMMEDGRVDRMGFSFLDVDSEEWIKDNGQTLMREAGCVLEGNGVFY